MNKESGSEGIETVGGLWAAMLRNATLVLALWTAAGTASGWLYYYGRYSLRFEIPLVDLSIPASEYLITGLTPVGILGLLAGTAIGAVRLKFRRGGTPRWMLITAAVGVLAIDAVALRLCWPVDGVVLVAILFPVVSALSVAFLNTRRTTAAVLQPLSLLAALVLCGSVAGGALAARDSFSSDTAFVLPSTADLRTFVQRHDLHFIAHGNGVWYFADGGSEWPHPVVMAFPDSAIDAVRIPTGRD